MLLVGVFSLRIHICTFFRVLTVIFFLIITFFFCPHFHFLERLDMLLGLNLLVCSFLRQSGAINYDS